MDSAGDDPCGPGFPIRTSADQRLLASPRGFSQRATSFIASMRQGIHRMPFETLDQQPISARFDSAARRPAPSPISPMPPSEPRNPAIPPDTLPRRTRVTRGPPAAGRSPASIAASRLSTMSNTRRDPAARPPSRGADTRRTARHRPWERPEAPPPIFGLPVLPVCPGRRAPVVAPAAPAPQGAWWRRTGSNRRPHACKARALPTELRPRSRPEPRTRSPGHGAPNTKPRTRSPEHGTSSTEPRARAVPGSRGAGGPGRT